MDAAPVVAVGDLFAGAWRVVAPLGAGAVGQVFRASPLEGGPDVALKLVPADVFRHAPARARFEREARSLSALNHPHVIGIVACGAHEGVGYLAMELLEGRTLDSLLGERFLQPDEALSLFAQVLDGLAFAHAHGVLHRDLKPANIFLSERDGRPHATLLDFGLAKLDRAVFQGERTLTGRGMPLGTPAYMAPEQFGGRSDARSDVYAAGVVLFEMLAGTWPFFGEDLEDLRIAHSVEDAPPLEVVRPELRVKPELEALVHRALEKRPDRRFPDAGALRRALGVLPKDAARVR